MKFGFVLPNNWGLPSVNPIIDLAVEAEDRGLDSVWVNHHVINVGYIADRLDDRPYYDALTVLTWVGARTSRVGLGTSVLVMPYLHPMVLAKAAATLDQLTAGRLILGLGVGSLEAENRILGVDYADRGSRSDEFIEVMEALWADGPADHGGPCYPMEAVVASPKPAQDPLPVWIGGSGGPAQRRAARYGAGWHPMCSVDGLARRMPAMTDRLSAEGRAREDIVVAPRIGAAQIPDLDAVEAWRAAGADQLIVGTAGDDVDAIRADLARLASLAETTRD